MFRATATTAALLAGVTFATPALAAAPLTITEPNTGNRHPLLEFHGGFVPWNGAPGVGMRFAIPLMKNGFIPTIDNAPYITFGFDAYTLLGRGRGQAFGIPVTLAWNFYFSEEWSAFGEAGIHVYVETRVFNGDDYFFEAGDWLIAAVGGRYHFNDRVALIGRVGAPYLSFGVEIGF